METERLTLYRKWYSDSSTISELVLDGKFFCFCLEDPVRNHEAKIHGETAIPAGVYPLALTWSPKYQRLMWLLKDVPNYRGVRVHSGNYPKDTEGCLLLGLRKGRDVIYDSRKAVKKFELLMEKESIFNIQIIDSKAI